MMEYNTVRGMQDFLPERARKKKYIESVCREAFEKYGFRPLETPIVEGLELLTAKGSSGEDIEKEIYSFEDKGGRKLSLRFDLTVPLARVMATYKEIPRPLKRYQIGRVYRYDRPQAKRYREFTQADIDIVGSVSVLCEFELAAVTIEIMQKLGIDFYITINSRELLEELALACGVQKIQVNECFRLLDKAEKIGWDEAEKEMNKAKINPYILSFVRSGDLEKAGEKIKSAGGNLAGLEKLLELEKMLKKQKLGKYVKFDLALARGLAYYTGMVFEVKTKSGPSIGGGGRYDNLIKLYGGQSLPATGISFGIERIMDTLGEKLDMPMGGLVFIVPLGGKALGKALSLAQKIRALGISAEMDLMERNISKNLEYANKKGIPFVILLGEKELKEKKFTLKEMKSGKQREIKFSELDKLKQLVKD